MAHIEQLTLTASTSTASFYQRRSPPLAMQPSPGQIGHATSNFVSLDVCQMTTELVAAIGQVQPMGVDMLGMVDV